MKEKLQEYALLAEIISAVCIVLSLIFVGIQIDQGADETAINSRAIEASVREQLLTADTAILTIAVENTKLQIGRVPDPADEEVIWALTNFYYMVFRTRESYWNHNRNGLLSDSSWHSYRQVFLLGANNPYFLKVWNDSVARRFWEQGFADEINRFMTDSGVDLDLAGQDDYPLPGVDI